MGRSGLPAHLRTRLKETPSSFRATRDVMLRASHVAATALLHHSPFSRGSRAPSALTGKASYEDRKLLRTTQFRTPYQYHAVPRISTIEEAACLRTYALPVAFVLLGMLCLARRM